MTVGPEVPDGNPSGGGNKISWATNGEFVCVMSIGDDSPSDMTDKWWTEFIETIRRWVRLPSSGLANAFRAISPWAFLSKPRG